MKELDLSKNFIDDEDVKFLLPCVHNIEKLLLRKCNISIKMKSVLKKQSGGNLLEF